MGTWNSRGLRGEALEEFINISIDKYKEKGLALIQKIPTPIKPVKMDQNTRQITLAYFDQKSTVDYIGVVQGIPICFDAKECQTDTFPLANIHQHQIDFMKDFEKQDGISFIILYFSHKNEFYYLPFRDILYFWERMEKGGRKSFTYDEVDKTYKIGQANGVIVHFLEAINIDLTSRNQLQS